MADRGNVQFNRRIFKLEMWNNCDTKVFNVVKKIKLLVLSNVLEVMDLRQISKDFSR